MNGSSERKRFLTTARVFWLAVTLVGVVLVVWSVPMFLRLGQRREELTSFLEIDRQDAAKIRQLDEWRSSADEAVARATADRGALFSMYKACRSPEDFFVVHPDHIVSVYHQTNDGFRLLFYAPPGDFQITADVDAEPNDPTKGNAAIEFEPVHREFTLQGGRAYEMKVELDRERGSEVRSLRIAVTDQEPEVITLDAVNLRGSRRAGNNLLQAPHYLSADGTSSLHELADTSLLVVRRSDDQGIWLRVKVLLQGSGPVRLPANDRVLLYRQTSAAASPTLLDGFEYRDGWYDKTAPTPMD